MRLLRAGGEYQAQRELWLWMALAALPTLVVAAGMITGDVFAVLAAMAVAIVPAKSVARRLKSVRCGQLGERGVTALLENLNDDYYLINDVVLGRHGNIDHVLIGPCGVVVIETKRVAGDIRCDGDDWYVDGYRRRSFSKQVNAGTVRVKNFLTEQHGELPPTAVGFVKSVVVLTHPLCRLDIHRARTTVARFSQLLQLVRDLAERTQMPAALAERLAATLANSQSSR